MTTRRDSALWDALRDELAQLVREHPGHVIGATEERQYAEALRGVGEVIELRQAFALARRRVIGSPPTPASVRAAFDETRAPRPPAATTPAERPVFPPTPQFDAAAAWLAANPWAEARVDAELLALTQTWPPELAGERERLRSVACLLVYNRRAAQRPQSA